MGLPYRIVQISDLHLLKLRYEVNMGIPPALTFQQILREIKRLEPAPKAIVLSGDISDAFSADSYYLVDRMMIPMELPYYWIPGNHDDVTSMTQLARQLSVEDVKSFQLGNRNVVLLNSVVPDEMHGRLSSESLQHLRDSLQEHQEMPSFVFLHHQPIDVNHIVDPIKLQNSEALFQILEAHPQVQGVFFGHMHIVVERVHAGVKYLSCPPSIFPFREVDSRSKYMMPGFRVIDWGENGDWESTVHHLDVEPMLQKLN